MVQNSDSLKAFVNTVANLWIRRKFLSSCTTSGFSRKAQLSDVGYSLLNVSVGWQGLKAAESSNYTS
jgi:hypothetical protein